MLNAITRRYYYLFMTKQRAAGTTVWKVIIIDKRPYGTRNTREIEFWPRKNDKNRARGPYFIVCRPAYRDRPFYNNAHLSYHVLHCVCRPRSPGAFGVCVSRETKQNHYRTRRFLTAVVQQVLSAGPRGYGPPAAVNSRCNTIIIIIIVIIIVIVAVVTQWSRFATRPV